MKNMLSPFNIKEKYNVLVIGAGPGGCRVAQLCAKEGLSVLILEKRPENMEVVMTGRDAPPQLQSMANYVTEMLKIKHPYDDGIIARRGIDY